MKTVLQDRDRVQSTSFDTLAYVDELEKSGMERERAQAISRATAKAFRQAMESRELATREDIREVEKCIHRTRETLFKMETDLKSFIIKTVIGCLACLSGVQTFFHFVK